TKVWCSNPWSSDRRTMNTSRRNLLIASVLLLASCSLNAQEADAKLESVFKTYLDAHFELRPLEATRLADHRFDSRLEELTPAARAKWLELTRKTLAALPKQVDYKKLSRSGQIDFETFQHSLKTDEWMAENMHPFEQDPRVYNDYINDSVYLLL